MTVPAKIYTEKEVEKARRQARVVGWAQGGGAVILAGFALRLLGWIPAILVVGLVVWVLYKLIARPDDGAPEG